MDSKKSFAILLAVAVSSVAISALYLKINFCTLNIVMLIITSVMLLIILVCYFIELKISKNDKTKNADNIDNKNENNK